MACPSSSPSLSKWQTYAVRYKGQLLEDMIAKVRERLGVFGWVEFLKLFLQAPVLPLDGLKSRTLVISGAHDQHCPVEQSEYLSQAIPDSCHHIIHDAGHFAIQSHGETVADVIQTFLYAQNS